MARVMHDRRTAWPAEWYVTEHLIRRWNVLEIATVHMTYTIGIVQQKNNRWAQGCLSERLLPSIQCSYLVTKTYDVPDSGTDEDANYRLQQKQMFSTIVWHLGWYYVTLCNTRTPWVVPLKWCRRPWRQRRRYLAFQINASITSCHRT